MTIILNHAVVPARDKVAAARFFARITGLDFKEASDHFAPVRVNETLTLLFNEDTTFDSHHYAFHVSDARVGQDDRWSFCLTAGTLCPSNQEIR